VHISKVHEIQAHACHLILMEGITLRLGSMSVLDTSEMNVLSVDKVNTLSFVCVLSLIHLVDLA